MTFDLNSGAFATAVATMKLRAEKEASPEILKKILVKTDLSLRVETEDTQLILGRRGTGKTHLVRAFQIGAQQRGDVVQYVDCRSLGSGYESDSPETIGRKYFVELLNDIGSYLHDQAGRLEAPGTGVEERLDASFIVGLTSQMQVRNGAGEPTFGYRQIGTIIERALEELEIPRYFIILDEWSSVHVDAQPHLAEYIKRAFLRIPEVSFKFVAVNYRTEFMLVREGVAIGLERGADIPNVVDIDGHLIYEEKSRYMEEFFAQVLYNHLGGVLGRDVESVSTEEKVRDIKALFTQHDTFVELVRAAEGNCRDFLQIFSAAYLDGYRVLRDSKAIGKKHVRNAAAAWYETEKYVNISHNEDAAKTLQYILHEVVKGSKARTFMVEEGKADHERIIMLLNGRVLHKLSRVMSHQDNPGLRYRVFTIDYGAYAQFINTVNEPRFSFVRTRDLRASDRETMVPFDDFRSIRRIIFDPDKVETWTPTATQLPLE